MSSAGDMSLTCSVAVSRPVRVYYYVCHVGLQQAGDESTVTAVLGYRSGGVNRSDVRSGHACGSFLCNMRWDEYDVGLVAAYTNMTEGQTTTMTILS